MQGRRNAQSKYARIFFLPLFFFSLPPLFRLFVALFLSFSLSLSFLPDECGVARSKNGERG